MLLLTCEFLTGFEVRVLKTVYDLERRESST
jgi:hypothetical protein